MANKVNAWRIFFHPMKWRDRIMELEEENINLAEDNGSQASLIRDLRREIARLESSNMNQSSKIVNLETAVKGLTSDLIKARMELDDRKDTETQIREFDAKVSRMAHMKKAYERKISVLKEEIRDLKTAMRAFTGELPGDEMNIIEMEDSPAAKKAAVAEKETEESDEIFRPAPVIFPDSTVNSQGDWLKPLPEM